MARAQAAPITVMIITAVIVVLGLALISYVTGLLSSHRESQTIMDFVMQVQSSTYMYVEQQTPSPTGGWVAYVGLLSVNPMEPMMKYYILVLPAELTNLSVPPVSLQVVDPPIQAVNITVRLSQIYLIARGGYMPAKDYYMLPTDLSAAVYEITFNATYGRPYLIEIDASWASPTSQAIIYLLVRAGNDNYYEITRVVFPTT